MTTLPRPQQLAIAALLSVLALPACPAAECQTGTDETCSCAGEQEGSRSCVEGSWEACSCAPQDAGVGLDAGAADAQPGDASESGDASAVDAAGSDASGSDSAGSDSASAPDASVNHDATEGDASGVDSSSPDAGASEDAGSCGSSFVDPCAGITGSGTAYTLELGNHAVSGAASFAVGDSLATVRSALSTHSETPSAFNPFAVVYCSEGLLLYFADNLESASAQRGVLGDDDTLYKVTALGAFSGSSDGSSPVALGDSAGQVATALGTADQSNSSGNDALRFWYGGHSLLLQDGVTTALSVFAPQSPSGTLGLALDLAGGGIGGVQVRHTDIASVPVASGSTLTAVRAVFGLTPEADGELTVTIASSDVDVLLLSYSVLGVRFSGLASQYSGFPPEPVEGDARKVFTAFLTPPFAGTDSGIGLGSTRAEIETRFGAAYAVDQDGDRSMDKYQAGSRRFGVVYVENSACVERAGLIVVNLID